MMPARLNRGQRELAASRSLVALRLRLRGFSYRRIARALGVSVRTAYVRVNVAILNLNRGRG